MPPLVGMSVQVTVVWFVIVGQLPQFDVCILYWMVEHSGATSVHLNIISLEVLPATSLICGGGKCSDIEIKKYHNVINACSCKNKS